MTGLFAARLVGVTSWLRGKFLFHIAFALSLRPARAIELKPPTERGKEVHFQDLANHGPITPVVKDIAA